jgi:hypothetical protein
MDDSMSAASAAAFTKTARAGYLMRTNANSGANVNAINSISKAMSKFKRSSKISRALEKQRFQVFIRITTKGGKVCEHILGYFDTEAEAMKVYQAAARKVQESRDPRVVLEYKEPEIEELKQVFGGPEDIGENGDAASSEKGIADPKGNDGEETKHLEEAANKDGTIEPVIETIVLKDDVDDLKYQLEKEKFDNETLRSRLNRRAKVLDSFRAQYLRDVVILKEQMTGKHENIEKYKKRSKDLSYMEDLPEPVLQRMMPAFDLRDSMPCFGPGNDLYMHVRPCAACGGYLEVMVYPEDKIKFVIEEYKKMHKMHTEIQKENDHMKLASEHMLKMSNNKGKEIIRQEKIIDELTANLRNSSNMAAAELESLMKLKHRKLLETIDRVTNESIQLEIDYRRKLATEIRRREFVEKEQARSLEKIGTMQKQIRGFVQEESRLTGVVQKQSKDNVELQEQSDHYRTLYLEMKDIKEATDIEIKTIKEDIEKARLRRAEKEKIRLYELQRAIKSEKSIRQAMGRAFEEKQRIAKQFGALRLRLVFKDEGSQKIAKAFSLMKGLSRDITELKLNNKIEDLNGTIREKKETVTMLLEESNSRNTERQSLASQLEATRQELDTLKDRFQSQSDHLENLNRHITQLKEQIRLQQVLLEKSKSASMDTQTHIQRVYGELARSKLRLTAHNVAKDSVYQAVINRGKKIGIALHKRFTSEIQAIMHELDMTNAKLEASRQHVEALTTELDESSTKSSKLSLALQESLEGIKEKSKTIAARDNDIRGLHETQEKLMNDIEGFRGEVQALCKANAALKEENDGLEKELAQLAGELGAIRGELGRSESKRQELGEILKLAEDDKVKALASANHMYMQVAEIKERKKALEDLIEEERVAMKDTQDYIQCLSQMYLDFSDHITPPKGDNQPEKLTSNNELNANERAKNLRYFSERKMKGQTVHRRMNHQINDMEAEIERLNELVSKLRKRLRELLKPKSVKRRGPPPPEEIPNFLRCRWEDPESYCSTSTGLKKKKRVARVSESSSACNLSWVLPPPLGDIIQPTQPHRVPRVLTTSASSGRVVNPRPKSAIPKTPSAPGIKIAGWGKKQTENAKPEAMDRPSSASRLNSKIFPSNRPHSAAGWRKLLNHGV